MVLDTHTCTEKDKRMLVLLALSSLIILFQLCIVSLDDDLSVTKWRWSQGADAKITLYRTIAPLTSGNPVETAKKISPRAAFLLRLPFPINSAGIEELEMLPGIGPKLAAGIDTYRTSYGRITDKHTLMKVPGIGTKLAARLTPLLTFTRK